jgi:mannose-1-phosphate guanylyltransferase/mannose-6-phosphate isomerase
MKIHPVVLCGGIGTRLWPLSRKMQPKQFQTIAGEGSHTFFQATIQRHLGGIFEAPLICVSQNHLETVRRQLRDIDCPARIIAEPVARNTGPAVLAAAIALRAQKPDAIMAVFPSDHVIEGDLNRWIEEASCAAAGGFIVTFGIVPRYPESGYGYILEEGLHNQFPCVRKVSSFIEKPDEKTAANLIGTGHAYWSSGISLFRADVLIEEYRTFDRGTYDVVEAALSNASLVGDDALLDQRSFSQAFPEPTERAVFERSSRLLLAPTDIGWDDVGAWAAFHTVGTKSSDGNVASGDVLMIDTTNSFVRSDERLVAVVGMSDVVVVDTHDAVLVTTRQNSQKVKKVVERLTELNRREVLDHHRHATDWGSVAELLAGSGFDLCLLDVKPHTLVPFAEQADCRRLLTVTQGHALVLIGESAKDLGPGESVEIGACESALVFNATNTNLQLVQVSCIAQHLLAEINPLADVANGRTIRGNHV